MSAIGIGESVLLGIVEGLTEFLPVSSTAHLRVTEAALGVQVDDPAVVAYTAVIQLGAIAAVLLYFARDLVGVVSSALVPSREPAGPWDRRLGWWIVVGTIPVVVVGFLAAPLITGPLASLTVVAVSLVVGSAWMVLGERLGSQRRGPDGTTGGDVLCMGAAQVLSVLLPGFSRSGATISAGLLRGLDRVTATRLSFLLSVPALVGAGLYELKDAIGPGIDPVPLAVGTLVSFGVALASIAWLLRIVAHWSLVWFVGYRLAAAGVLGILLLTGVLAG